jgi:hypothetical protein
MSGLPVSHRGAADSGRRRGPSSRAVAVLAVSIGLMAVAPAADAAPFVTGDVFGAIGNGKVKVYAPATGAVKQTLDDTTGSTFTTGMCFDSLGNLYVTNFSLGGTDSSLSKFDKNGNLLDATFANFPGTPESCVVNSADEIWVSGPGSPLVRFNSSTGAQLASFPAGGDWIDLAADQCTMYILSEDATVRRFNTCTNTELTPFATGLSAPCYALRIRTNGEVMAACQPVVRLNSSGGVIQSYPSLNGMFALNLDPDGTSFWTGVTGGGDIFRAGIASGTTLKQFDSQSEQGLFGLAVFGELTVGNPTGKISARGTVSDTGGGTVQLSAANNCVEVDSTRGFQVRWTGGGSFTKTAVTTSTCSNDTSLPTSPAGFNKQVGTATGTLNGGGAGTISWTFKDGGPGGIAADKVAFTIRNASNAIVKQVNEQSAGALSGTPGGVWTFAP